ncbi:MAG: ABC transporter ATP-binding protein [Bacteroidota bacterium]
MLIFNNINKTFHVKQETVEALKNISFELEEGTFLTVNGPSGCGKTTLLLIAGSLLHPTSGNVTIDGQDPYKMDNAQRNKLRANTLGFVFQQFHLIPYLSVRENIVSPALATGNHGSSDRAQQLAEHFGLAGRMDHYPYQMSMGEKQRTALARALFNRPQIILADEPTGNLDEDNAHIIFSYLQEYTREGGSVLLVSHDSKAAQYSTRVLNMKDGKIL